MTITQEETQKENTRKKYKIEQMRQEINSKVRSLFLFSTNFETLSISLNFTTFNYSAYLNIGEVKDDSSKNFLKATLILGARMEVSLTWDKQDSGWYLDLADVLFNGFKTLNDLSATSYVKELPRP